MSRNITFTIESKHKKIINIDKYFEKKEKTKFDKKINGNNITYTIHLKNQIKDLESFNKKYEVNAININLRTQKIEKELSESEQLHQDRVNEVLKTYENIIWRPWQQDVLDILESEPDNRTINWFYEPNGNKGKSFLCKYIACKYDVIICDGKKDNVFNQVNDMLKKQNFKTVILDIPRCNMEQHISYNSIEAIKNGMLYSGKYQGGQCIFNNVHIIIFSNSEPDVNKLSNDRWNIINIDDYNNTLLSKNIFNKVNQIDNLKFKYNNFYNKITSNKLDNELGDKLKQFKIKNDNYISNLENDIKILKEQHINSIKNELNYLLDLEI